MSTLCVFRVIESCCGGCRSNAKKALEEAYGVSVKFDMEEEKLIVEGDAVDPAKIIEKLQKVKVELVDGPKQVSTTSKDEELIVNHQGKKKRGFFGRFKGSGSKKGDSQNAGDGSGGSGADGAEESNRVEEVNTSQNSSNGEEENDEAQGGNMGLMVRMGQRGPNYYHPGYDMYPHYNPNGGYPQHNMHPYDNAYGGYPQQPINNMHPYPMDNYFSEENANGCTVM